MVAYLTAYEIADPDTGEMQRDTAPDEALKRRWQRETPQSRGPGRPDTAYKAYVAPVATKFRN